MRIAAICGVLLCSSAALAQPNPRREAGEHFKRGEAAQASGHCLEAIAEYEQAYALVPHANALFNIAVCYEKLDNVALAAEYYQRYLDDDSDGAAADAESVTVKIRALRARAEALRPHAVQPPATVHEVSPPPPPDELPPPLPAPEPPTARWHGGASYGVGFGDVPVERYLAHAGVRVAGLLDVDGVLGSFGKNDYAAGLMAKLVIMRTPSVTPFGRAALTIGYAKQDASRMAGARFPIGLEVGGGVQLGSRGALELSAVVRWVRGGWDASSTTADSYVNDEMAIGFDLGFTFDFGVIAAAR